MAKALDFSSLINKKYNRLTIISEGDIHKTIGGHKHRTANTICDCGAEKTIQVSSILNGKISSCGCLSKEILSKRASKRNSVHGYYGTPEYNSWVGMKKRCLNKKHKKYFDYGGRGIKVFEPWLKSFSSFLADLGERPSLSHSLERIDNNGNYEPSNCIWATKKDQCRNQRTNVLIEYKGEVRCLADWAEIYGLSWQALFYRVFTAKWPIDKAFTAKNSGPSNKHLQK